ncbi:DUF4825 domain-containing protein [Bacillus sp. CHD6a]|uniref:DUF4825 domain-containing protein n=1 Tax=Bacillus sp. CHD6a TaxID=1643452 RepID=UPI0006CC3A1D|nr:DUF4825 domain-containing protein [Bacillus sp. CHD6a]KPB04996.1 hypothetical protein AAV98_09840 [Bacillus sp. CHD6a]
MSKELDKKLRTLPKPKLKEETKNELHQAIMNHKGDKTRVGWLPKVRSAALMTLSVVALALFSFILFTGTDGEPPRSSAPEEEKSYENYIAYLKSIEVHDQIDAGKAFIGNPGALGQYHGQVLPGRYYANGMELQTNEEQPMGIHMYYKVTEETSAKGFEKDVFHVSNLPWTIIFNATTYFTFFINGDYVTFDIDYYGENRKYTLTRQHVEDLYERDVKDYVDDQELWNQEVIEKTLQDEKKVQDFMERIRVANTGSREPKDMVTTSKKYIEVDGKRYLVPSDMHKGSSKVDGKEEVYTFADMSYEFYDKGWGKQVHVARSFDMWETIKVRGELQTIAYDETTKQSTLSFAPQQSHSMVFDGDLTTKYEPGDVLIFEFQFVPLIDETYEFVQLDYDAALASGQELDINEYLLGE